MSPCLIRASAALFLILMTAAPAAAVTCAMPHGARAEVDHVIAATNALRQARGMAPLRVSPVLMATAQAHACAMVANDSFSHRGASGSTPKVRIRAAGCRSRLTAENIAAGFSSGAKTMKLWTDSPGHMRNILRGGVNSIGVGVAAPRPGQGGGPRWVQDFAAGC